MEVLETLKDTVNRLNFYPDMNAYDLKESLAKKYSLEHDNIILGNGSEGIISYIMKSFVAPGSKIVTSEATFIGFQILAKGVGANLVQTPLTSDMRFDVDAIIEACCEETRVIYIANPNNPTGTYLRKDEFEKLVDNAPKTTLIILDEAYLEFAKDTADYPDTMKYRLDNVLTLRTFSKSYGLAGLRLGYGFGHKDLIVNLHKVKLPFEPSLLAQTAGITALKCDSYLERTVENNSKNYNKLFEFLDHMGLSPIESKANFICFKANSPEHAKTIHSELLNQGVIIRDLIQNGLPSHLRVSIGLDNEVDYFIEKVKELKKEGRI